MQVYEHRNGYGYDDGYDSGRGYSRNWERVQRLRAAIAADRYRLKANRRRGRYGAAERDACGLARHEDEALPPLRRSGSPLVMAIETTCRSAITYLGWPPRLSV